MTYMKKVTVLLLALAFLIQPLSGTVSRAAANGGRSTHAEKTTTNYIALDNDTD